MTSARTARLISVWNRLEHSTTQGMISSGKITRLTKPGFCSISDGARLMHSEKMPKTSSPANSTTANSRMLADSFWLQRALNTTPKTNV